MKPISILNKLNEWSELETDDYIKFNHINDVWNYLEESNNENDLKNRISKVDPHKFGSIYYDLHKDGRGATVIVDYQDDNEDYYEKVDIYFNSNLNESSVLVDKPVFMNTWANYNENGGLDLETKYGIKDGWMTIDEALDFCKKYAEDEPFICDTDGVPIEISNYDNAEEKLNELKEIEDADVDEDVLTAFIEEGRYNDIHEIIEKIEDGDYIFFPGVDNDEDLAREYIDMCGGITAAVSPDRLDSYFDEDDYKEENRDAFREMMAENEDRDVDDISDEEVDEWAEMVMQDELATAKYDHNDSFFESYFDYKAFGDELSYDYFYASTGALSSF